MSLKPPSDSSSSGAAGSNPGPAAPLVRTETHQGVAAVLLARPEKRNAMTPAMLDQLFDHLRLAIDTADALVLSGDGAVFCGGFDLKLCHTNPGTLTLLLQRLHDIIVLMRSSEKPVLVAAQGAAIAGACALLGGADIAITNRDAALGYPVVPLGISPAISAPFLAQRVTFGQARLRLLDPGLIDGVEASRINLVDICCDIREDVMPRAMRLARQLANKPPHAFANTKQLIREIENTQGAQFAVPALQASLSLTESPEQQSRLAAMWTR